MKKVVYDLVGIDSSKKMTELTSELFTLEGIMNLSIAETEVEIEFDPKITREKEIVAILDAFEKK
ncbi:MAG: hypothetical protein DWQ06_02600 [Calditrichaeota bacterium]|nr:MAG: hypothetical protein DWQ06_02600 [Calditrichota bacterium]